VEYLLYQKTKSNYFSLIFGVKNCSKPFLETGLTNFNALYCKIHEKLIKSYEFLNLKPLKTGRVGEKSKTDKQGGPNKGVKGGKFSLNK